MSFLFFLFLYPLLVFSQSWDFDFVEFVTEDIPLWKAVIETQRNGSWDLGHGRSVKAIVFELGGCLRGHPCASATGIPWLYPEGCDTTMCVDRFPGDPWLNYDWDCRAIISADNIEWQQPRFGNMTQISTEWSDFQDTSCLIRYLSETDTWELAADGVAIVLRTQGFNFPPQQVIVSDIDSADEFFRFTWPDIMQEASVNFAMRGTDVIKPINTYALDHYDSAELVNSPPSLTQINVTLRQELFDALDLRAESTWVMGSMSAFTSDNVYDFVEFKMPEHFRSVAGGSVWAEIPSEFDTWVSVMSLGRKSSSDRDQRLNVNPLRARKTCRCSQFEETTLIVLPTSSPNVCSTRITPMKSYRCQQSGLYLCNEIRFTAWDKTGPDNADGKVPCSPRNSTKPVFVNGFTSDGAGTTDWSIWPTL